MCVVILLHVCRDILQDWYILSNWTIPVMSMRQRGEKVWCSHICCSWLIRIIEFICVVYSSLHNYYLYIKSCMCTMPKVLEVHGSMLRDVHYTDSGCTFSLGWLWREFNILNYNSVLIAKFHSLLKHKSSQTSHWKCITLRYYVTSYI